MIIVEDLGDGLKKRYSDKNVYMRQEGTGILYPEAIDIVDKTYTETDILIDGDEEATEDDYKAIVEELLGL